MYRRWILTLIVPLLSVPACEKPAPPDGPETAAPADSKAGSAEAPSGKAGSPVATPAAQPAKGTLPSGVEFTVLKPGTGATPKAGQEVRVHLTGWLPGGKEFLNTRSGGTPDTYKLDKMGLISGLVDTLLVMKEGERRRVRIPSDEAYGANGYLGVVPANSDLEFEVELVGVVR